MRALVSVKLILLLVAAIHLDWHLARPHSMRPSLDWDLHWLTGVLAFGALAWFVVRKWPTRSWEASAINIGAAVVGAQIICPMGEAAYYLHRFAPPTESLRWAIFAQFFAAGMLAYLGVMSVLLRRSRDRVSYPVEARCEANFAITRARDARIFQ